MSLPGAVPIPVVFDVNVLVAAGAGGNSPFRSWPSPPPLSGNPSADSVGVIVDGAEFSLWLSPHIVEETARVLAEVLAWDPAQVQRFTAVISAAAQHSGGAMIEPARSVHDCPDWEDNLVLDLVVDCGALMLVSNDTDLLAMSPWRGIPIVTPTQFAARVDGMRRHRRAGR
ncbi:MAG: PIN domain-containing protein [Sporichthyaceae bacterium]